MPRVIAAAMIAPLAVPVGLAVDYGLRWGLPPLTADSLLEWGHAWARYYLLCVAFGAPVVVLGTRRGSNGSVWLAQGALAGAVAAVVYGGATYWTGWNHDEAVMGVPRSSAGMASQFPALGVIGAFGGAITAAAFVLIAGLAFRRPAAPNQLPE